MDNNKTCRAKTKTKRKTKKSVHNVEVVDQESKNDEEFPTIADENVSTKIQTLRNNKKSAKTRLTKAKKQLNDLVGKQLPGLRLESLRAFDKIGVDYADRF